MYEVQQFFYIYTEICSPLMTPLNGHINYNSTTFSSLAYYSCNIGYKIIGTNVLQCVEEGLWNNTPPTCQGIFGFKIMKKALHFLNV